jgi:hypothetical protein
MAPNFKKYLLRSVSDVLVFGSVVHIGVGYAGLLVQCTLNNVLYISIA